MKAIKKIVTIGPESTGKSTLAQLLAKHYNTLWVPEYARQYLEENGTAYEYSDLQLIAEGQVAGEDRITASLNQQLQHDEDHSPFLFIDTDLYVIKVWSEYVFNRCDNRWLRQIAERKYDGYLLCATDLPWQADELREYPNQEIRDELFEHYKDLLINQPLPWCTISGDYDERFQKAVVFVDSFA